MLSDSVALSILIVLILVQIGFLHWCRRRTVVPLEKQRRQLNDILPRFQTAVTVDELPLDQLPLEVRRALTAAYPTTRHEEVLEPRAAFDDENLLPSEYNARLDAAVPGLFTALGILGTFLGLTVAFFRIDFSDSVNSIPALMGAMTLSFLNSLLGVAISFWWTVRARNRRHKFDVASRALVDVVETRFGRPAHGTQVLRAFAELRDDVRLLQSGLGDALRDVGRAIGTLSQHQHEASERMSGDLLELRTTTQGASRDLLESLAPRLEATFRSLVDLPFERLGDSVEQFRSLIDETAGRHESTLTALDASVTQLTVAQTGLVEAVTTARGCVDDFSGAATVLRDNAGIATDLLAESRRATDTLRATVDTFVITNEHQGSLATALGAAVSELRGTAGALDASSARFDIGADRLERAAKRIEQLGPEAAESSLRTMREELQTTASRMAESLQMFGDRNVAAYETSTGRVIEALDERVTDLTDRLSAELQTLATRLPESAAEITNATRVLRKQLGEAVRSLEQAVRTVDAGTTQALVARLKEYDGLVAQAVDRFSGTLVSWDGQVREFHEAAADLRTGAVESLREAANAARAAADAARAVRDSRVNDPAAVTSPSGVLASSARLDAGVPAMQSGERA